MFFVSWCRHFYYIIEFLFVKRGDLMSVLSTNHRDHSLSYEHELFSISSKKIYDWTERLHDKWHFCYVVVSGSLLQTKWDYISIWTSILIKCSVCCVCLYEWFVWDSTVLLHEENECVRSLCGIIIWYKRLIFFVSDSKLESHFETWNGLTFRQRVQVSCWT